MDPIPRKSLPDWLFPNPAGLARMREAALARAAGSPDAATPHVPSCSVTAGLAVVLVQQGILDQEAAMAVSCRPRTGPALALLEKGGGAIIKASF